MAGLLSLEVNIEIIALMVCLVRCALKHSESGAEHLGD